MEYKVIFDRILTDLGEISFRIEWYRLGVEEQEGKRISGCFNIYHHLIEEGLTFKDREMDVSGKRCDHLFQDKEGKDRYIEVKLKASFSAGGQLGCYRNLVKEPSKLYFQQLDQIEEMKNMNNRIDYLIAGF
ncbi:endonuclease NucS [Evansella sp. LMS18]|uniref:endonuclease NucS domain-containing protein n=1 Tax=Evansella sp. LMS18 TaxID=2924033 RepID=UPI0020D1CCBF|nr:endonuclease NucS domain-containing protein [Evansella sp. LMS18]UTR10230.1 endonuclease NucS [Evansella sp. LMS18]